VIGTILNAAGIIAGGIAGLILRRQPSPATQMTLKNILGLLTIFVGLRLTWISLDGGFTSILKQLGITVLAMILGRITGRLLHIQKGMNRLGQYAKEAFARASPEKPKQFNEGFITCTVLFCAAPLSILGGIQDGLGGHWGALGVKALVDGMAALAFVGTFGWGTILSVVPVVAFQGTITLIAGAIGTHLSSQAMVDSIHAVGGLLTFCVALIILEVRRVEVADYLPSLAFAPLLAWLWL
jgi:uncharacterized membrane protein YqgA involved in biofilm formation